MTTKHKINRILGVTNWSKGKLANLIGASNGSVWLWSKGKQQPKDQTLQKIDWLYKELVEPFICEIETRAEAAEEKLLKAKIKDLSSDNICKG